MQRMIDLQDDCPHPGCAGLDSTQHLRVRERLMRGDGVTSQDQACWAGADKIMSSKKWGFNVKMTRVFSV